MPLLLRREARHMRNATTKAVEHFHREHRSAGGRLVHYDDIYRTDA